MLSLAEVAGTVESTEVADVADEDPASRGADPASERAPEGMPEPASERTPRGSDSVPVPGRAAASALDADDDGSTPPIGVPSRSLGRFWAVGFPALIAVCALLLPVLFTVGKNTILSSTDGRLLGEITDPTQPGWQRITEPTPTLLLVQTDIDGTPSALTVLSLTGEDSGGMIFIPTTTVLAVPGVGNVPLDAAFERAGIDGLQKAVEGLLAVGMDQVAVVDPDGWADLVTPLGSVEVTNPDDVKVIGAGGARVVRFAKGAIAIGPDDVAPYLATVSPGENGVNQLVRQQAFWEAWLRAVAASPDPAVVPGETTSGLGSFVRALAADRVEMAPLPVTSASIPGSDLAVYLPVPEQVGVLVARLIPFPVGAPPGARPRVRVLDGAGTLDHGLGAVGSVVAAGGQVDQIGNADEFGHATTELVYSDDAQLEDVDRLRAAIGIGELVKVPQGQTAIDVTITLGADYAAQPPPSLAPVTTAVR